MPTVTTPAKSRTCEECRFCVFQDYGYSNWTVEGSEAHCAKGKFESFEQSGHGQEDSRFDLAKTCLGYEYGETLHLAVHLEETPTDEKEKEVFMMYMGYEEGS